MVFGILTAVVACPAIVGTTEGIRYGQKQNNRQEHRSRKYNLTVTLLKRSIYSAQFDSAPIVLENGKLYVDTRRDVRPRDDEQELFPATVSFREYPEKKQVWRKAGYAGGDGLTTVINDQRFLNWVYVDRQTHEVKYGVRAQSEGEIVGPWDTTKIDRRLVFQGWEGFIAVQEKDGDDMWALYFDVLDDGLTSEGRIGNDKKRMLEVEVWRKEMRRDWEDAFNERTERLETREKLGHTVE